MAVATALAIGGAVAGVGGSLYSGLSGQRDAQAQAEIEKFNAALALQNEKAIEAKTRLDQIFQQRQAKAKLGHMTAQYGASGVMLSEGAPMYAMAEQAVQNAIENSLIGIEGRTRAAGFATEAASRTMQADVYKERGASSLLSGFLSAGAAGMQGLSSIKQAGM